MKEIGTDHWDSPNAGATNESGFTAVGSGYGMDNQFAYLNSGAFFWSSPDIHNTSYKRYTLLNDNKLYILSIHTEDDEVVSIRCIKNE